MTSKLAVCADIIRYIIHRVAHWNTGTVINLFQKLFVGVSCRKRDITNGPWTYNIIYYIIVIIVHPIISWWADRIRKFVKYNVRAGKMRPIRYRLERKPLQLPRVF